MSFVFSHAGRLRTIFSQSWQKNELLISLLHRSGLGTAIAFFWFTSQFGEILRRARFPVCRSFCQELAEGKLAIC